MKIRIPTFLKFSTFVWLLSVFLTATFFITFDSSKSGVFGGPIEMFYLMISIGFICSIPNWILFSITTWKINQLELPEHKKKILINIAAVAMTFLLFLILPYFTFIRFSLKAAIPYSLTLTLGIWIFPLKNKTTDMAWRKDILDDNLFKKM